MDPNANLVEQRQLVVRILHGMSKKANELEHDATRLAELVDAMDHWLSSNGFSPTDWETKTNK